MFKVLVAEDEKNLLKLISKSLQNAGYETVEATDGIEALKLFESEYIDIVVTDVMMPRMDGIELATQIRKTNTDVPILILTALGEIDDKVKGFTSGADDYMVKPIVMKELQMRVKSLLKRYRITCENKIELPHTSLSFQTNTVHINGENIELPKKMFLLLYKLLSNPDRIFTRLMTEIWGYDNESEDRTVDTHIKLLRSKAASPDYEIVTVRGLGYKVVIK